jgi:hypothetical protein
MKWLLILLASSCAFQTFADPIDDDFAQIFEENQYGKMDAASRAYFYDQMTSDIQTLYTLQEQFDQLGDGAQVAAIGQNLNYAEQRRDATASLASDFSYEAAETAQLEIAKMRSDAQEAFAKYR